MFTYLQQEEVARLRHEELLERAAQERLLAHLRQERAYYLRTWLQQLWAKRRKWFAPQHSVTVEGPVAAAQRQAC
jgi:hypothetical protein